MNLSGSGKKMHMLETVPDDRVSKQFEGIVYLIVGDKIGPEELCGDAQEDLDFLCMHMLESK